MKRQAPNELDRPNSLNKIPKLLNDTQLAKIAQNIFSNEGITEIQFILIGRLIESNSSYQTLLNLRRTSHWYCNEIDHCLTKTLNERYKSEDYWSQGFQILKPASIPYHTPLCFTADLQQALVLYFHAQRNREQVACLAFIKLFDSHLESFKSNCQNAQFHCNYDLFDCHLEAFAPNFQGSEFQFNSLQVFFGSFKFNQLEIIIHQPFSAYLFTHFLNRYVISTQFIKFINVNSNNPLMRPILAFLKTYKSFDSVTRILEEIMLKLFQVMQMPQRVQLKRGAFIVLQTILEYGLIDKPLAIKFELIQTIASCFSDNDGRSSVLYSLTKCAELGLIDPLLVIKLNLIEKITSFLLEDADVGLRSYALSCITKFVTVGLIDPPLVIRLHLIEKIAPFLLETDVHVRSFALPCIKEFVTAGLIDSSSVFDLVEKIAVSFSVPNVQDAAWDCMTTIIRKGLIDSSLEEKLDLIEKIAISLPCYDAFSCLQDCANKDLINHFHIPRLNLIEKLASCLSDIDPDADDYDLQDNALSCMGTFAEKGLISHYHLANLNLIETFEYCLSNQYLQYSTLACISIFAKQGLIDLSSETNLNLFKKIASLLPNWGAVYWLKEFAKKDLIEQSLVPKLQLVEKMTGQRMEIRTLECLLTFFKKGLIDRSVLSTLNLTETINRDFLMHRDFLMPKLPTFSLPRWQLGAAIVCLGKLAENGFIDLSTVMKYNLIEKIRSFLLITEDNVNNDASSCLKIFEDKGLITDEIY